MLKLVILFTKTINFITVENGEALDCCVNNQLPPQPLHRYCDPISMVNDRFYSQKGVTCMNFVRSMLALDDNCLFGHAEQVCR